MTLTPLLSPQSAILFLVAFAVAMLVLTALVARRTGRATVDSFLVARRNVPWWIAGPSIAAGWTWAVALMVSVQSAYQDGFPGIFWFTVPNVFAVLIYIWLGPQIRKLIPQGYSLPEWMQQRFKDKKVTYLYIFVYFYYQVMACAVQITAGGSLLSAATGINVYYLMVAVLAITLLYCIVSGLQASLISDFLQLASLLTVGAFIVTLVYRAAGGQMSLHGAAGKAGLNPFDYKIALTVGVIQTIGLLSGAIGDQPFWQRALAIRGGQITASFVFGGLLFAAIPIGLSILGFTGAAPGVHLSLPAGFDPANVGFAVVQHLLPPAVATLFVFLLLAALCSSLDSALVASSSLYRLVRTRPWSVGEHPEFSVRQGRAAMVSVGLAGLVIGLVVKTVPGFDLKYLWWLLNTIGASVAVPTVLSLYWPRLTARGILIGSSISLVVGLPIFVYGSVQNNSWILSGTYVGIVVVTALSCVLTAKQPEFVPEAA